MPDTCWLGAGLFADNECDVRPFTLSGPERTLSAMTTISLEKQAVSPRDGMVFCPLRYTDVHVAACLACDRLVRSDEIIPPRYVICDARMLERAEGRAR